jgi:pSer/pThr/pTyr-binding forkhead associated (FHA) protein/tetratricopeptide (TPR) repeat protein
LKLHIRDDDGRLTIVPVVRDSITIGRSEGNTIRLPERNVSRQHARLLQDDGMLYLEEVRSRYGTRVNGDPIGGRRAVNPGDVIEIGDYRLALHEDTNEIAVKTTSEMPILDRDDTPIAIPRSEPGGDPNAVTAMIKLADLPASVEMEEERSIPKASQARLVVLTPQLVGIEHTLTDSPTVIGRTSDSAFQIDHRSISHDHAMITWSKESGYTLHDLGSANGLKVNGDFYKRIDLHAADELELGHVKVRFVAPNEQFVVGLSPGAGDLDDFPIATEAPSLLAKTAVAIAGLVAIGVVGFWILNAVEPTPPEQSATEDDAPMTSLDPNQEPESSPVDEAFVGSNETPLDKAPADEKPPLSGTEKPMTEEPTPETPKPEMDVAPETPKAPTDVPEVETTQPVTPTPTEPVETTQEDKKMALAWARKAKKQLKTGNTGDATRLAKRALRLDKKQSMALGVLRAIKNDRIAEKSLNKAQTAARKSDWKQVLRHALAGIKKRPNSTLGKSLRTLRDQAKRKLAAPKPEPGTGGSKLEQAKALYRKATTAKRSGDVATAEKLYKQCLKIHAGMGSCRKGLVPLLMARGKICPAVRHMRRYVKAYPGAKKTPSYKNLILRFEAQCN